MREEHFDGERMVDTARFTGDSSYRSFIGITLMKPFKCFDEEVRAFNRLDMAVWRVLLNLSVTLLPTNGVVGIDASGFDRSHALKHYTKRMKLTIRQLKVTLFGDTKSNAIIDLHMTTTRKHDSQIVPSLIKRNTDEVAILLGDKGYDDQKIRMLAHEEGVRPLIKHREFSSLHKACNAWLDADLYGQRSQTRR